MELNNFLKKLNNSKQKMHFPDERKKAVRGRILYLVNLTEKPAARPASFFFPILRPIPIIAGFLVLLFVGSSVSFAAEGALPGDILYPVKIGINENVIAAVQLTPAAKASWEVDKTERRLSEASALIAKGKVTPQVQAQVENNFDVSAGQAQATIQSLDNAGNATTAAQIAAQLEAVLKAHQQILADVQNPDNTSSTYALQDNLNDKLAKVEAIRAVIQAKIASNEDMQKVVPDAKNGIAQAQSQIASVKKFVDDNSEKLSIDAVNQAQQKLSDASQEVQDAQSELGDSKAGDAFNSANNASEKAQKLQVLLQTKLNLGIPTGDGISISSSTPNSSSTPASTTIPSVSSPDNSGD